MISMDELMNRIKRHPRYAEVGMILCHNGVVRGTSRDGRRVSGLRVAVNQATLDQVLADHRRRPGILDIQVAINADRDLAVGDDVMFLVVAGDIRENVVRTLSDTLNAIKSSVTAKTEFFV